MSAGTASSYARLLSRQLTKLYKQGSTEASRAVPQAASKNKAAELPANNEVRRVFSQLEAVDGSTEGPSFWRAVSNTYRRAETALRKEAEHRQQPQRIVCCGKKLSHSSLRQKRKQMLWHELATEVAL